MKKAETIIKEMFKLEKELLQNYTAQQIVEAFEKLESKDNYNAPTIDSCTGQLYDGAYNQIKLNEFCNDLD